MPDDARPSGSTPAKQERTAAKPVKVSIEVHVVPNSDQDVEEANESPLREPVSRTLSLVTGDSDR